MELEQLSSTQFKVIIPEGEIVFTADKVTYEVEEVVEAIVKVMDINNKSIKLGFRKA